jgi:hypothetical protein
VVQLLNRNLNCTKIKQANKENVHYYLDDILKVSCCK